MCGLSYFLSLFIVVNIIVCQLFHLFFIIINYYFFAYIKHVAYCIPTVRETCRFTGRNFHRPPSDVSRETVMETKFNGRIEKASLTIAQSGAFAVVEVGRSPCVRSFSVSNDCSPTFSQFVKPASSYCRNPTNESHIINSFIFLRSPKSLINARW